MLSILIIFITASAISFLGSLQLGPVNLFVINTVLFTNKKSAFYVAVGGAIPEFIYCALAILVGNFIKIPIWFNNYLNISIVVLLVIMGFIFYFKKAKITPLSNSLITSNFFALKYFCKGFLFALLNPQLLPFWIVVQLYFNANVILKITTLLQKTAFILGAGVGAFALLITLLLIVSKYKQQVILKINHTYLHKILSLLFFILALQQLLQLMF